MPARPLDKADLKYLGLKLYERANYLVGEVGEQTETGESITGEEYIEFVLIVSDNHNGILPAWEKWIKAYMAFARNNFKGRIYRLTNQRMLRQMRKYDKSRKCVKCGGVAATEYVDKSGYSMETLESLSAIPGGFCLASSSGKMEHILRTCLNCGYKWKEEPLDKGKLAADIARDFWGLPDQLNEKPIGKEKPVSRTSQELQEFLNYIGVWPPRHSIREAKRQQELQDLLAKVKKEHASWWEIWWRHFCG